MLKLQDGTIFRGTRFGHKLVTHGEVCFTTAMVGYEQTLTDPSYDSQILVFSSVLQGNYGVRSYKDVDEFGVRKHFESSMIQVNGVIVSEHCQTCPPGLKTLEQWMNKERIPGLTGVDTRKLTEHLRKHGCMRGVICDDEAEPDENPYTNLVTRVSANDEHYFSCGSDRRVILVDCGYKLGIVRALLAQNLDVHVVNYETDLQPYVHYAGIVISNGPGDPLALMDTTVKNVRAILHSGVPIFGICLGHQIIALAAGFSTYKMKFGNRGLNHPCIDSRTSKCYMTSQNHGYAVDTSNEVSGWSTLFTNVNDGTNEGLIHTSLPIMSVQFHPEGSPGPRDTMFLFEEFTRPRTVQMSKWIQPVRNVQTVLVLGSGGLTIGQSGEFDYSGSQAIKALKEEGIKVILVNPNIASVQSSETEHVYYYPLTPEFVERIIDIEKPDGILLSFGGQTALNCGVAMKDFLIKRNVKVLGTSIETIVETEERAKFAAHMKTINAKTIESRCVTSVKDAIITAAFIGFPVLVRASFTLGGLGSGFANNVQELTQLVKSALSISDKPVIIDRSVKGFKELEFEVMRDVRGNCITVCAMENMDPTSWHTADSVVVCPTQTITNDEYFAMRETAIRVISSLQVVGECNIQFALDPKTSEFFIIEVNARLSRSSALASKATGYPLAYIAAKLALGKLLPDLTNELTRTTSACFEPSLDYVVVKIPHWDFSKFSRVSREIGPAMKSIGEVMGIGRNFEEALQKAMRMNGMEAKADNIDVHDSVGWSEINTDRRLLAIVEALRSGSKSVQEIHMETQIDEWFLYKMCNLKKRTWSDVTDVLHPLRIDTSSGEFEARSNYMYLSKSCETTTIDTDSKDNSKSVLVLGGGTYRIGSSCEFDWCAVQTLRTLRAMGIRTVMINHNPETVSTDFDECDALYFEELSVSTIFHIYKLEHISMGIIVAVGGQLPNSLAEKLEKAGCTILGTAPKCINMAENREIFSKLLDQHAVAQPAWRVSKTRQDAIDFADEAGFPVLVRPSFVLSGSAMNVAHNHEQLARFLDLAKSVNAEHPVIMSSFIEDALEVEFDAVAQRGKLINFAISSHVENAGHHSGDATLMLPPDKLYMSTMRQIRKVAQTCAELLHISGPFNLQFLCKNNKVMVIECNVRASRSFPFVSKALGVNFINLATRAMFDTDVKPAKLDIMAYNHVCVKVPMFSFARMAGFDPVCGVEMASTGEVACFAKDAHEAFLLALMAANFKIPQKNIFVSIGLLKQKLAFVESMKELQSLGYTLFGTSGTAELFSKHGVDVCPVGKLHDEKQSVESDQKQADPVNMLMRHKFHLVINIPLQSKTEDVTDGYLIRTAAIRCNIPLISNLQQALLLVEAMRHLNITAGSQDISHLVHLRKASQFFSH